MMSDKLVVNASPIISLAKIGPRIEAAEGKIDEDRRNKKNS